MKENARDGIGFFVGFAGLVIGGLMANNLAQDLEGLTRLLVFLAVTLLGMYAPLLLYHRLTSRR